MTRKQCKACPWKTSTVPDKDIPGGYCEQKHRNLKKTVARPGEFTLGTLPAMACHESKPGAERMCVGWVHNQLGPGNNIALRFRVLSDRSIADYTLDGPQHEHFEDTLP